MHKIAVIAVDDVVPFDLSIPCEIFDRARTSEGARAYHVVVCGQGDVVRSRFFDLRLGATLADAADADTIIVPGLFNPFAPVAEDVIHVVQDAYARDVRLVSICSGAFILAAAGVLNGRRATTHWAAAAELALRYPDIEVDPCVLFVDGGQIVTSAGAAAGIDTCLHLVRRDLGQTAATEAARLTVAALNRDGGQAQFIEHPQPPEATSLAPLLEWLATNASKPLTLTQIACRAGMSVRTLNRRFREQTSVTPLQWLLSTRSRLAQELLETTTLSIETIAESVGFDGASRLRERFHRDLGTSPQQYRRSFADRSAQASKSNSAAA